jgi:DNA-binding MarR family transcriptional regulator
MAQTIWLTEAEQLIWRRWLSVNRELLATLNRSLERRSGISLADYEVLVRLTEDGATEMRAAALADALGWGRSRLSHQLRRMEAAGLITRRTCQDDGRGCLVGLTSHGRQSIEDAAPGHVDDVRRCFIDAMAAGDLEVLGRAITQIANRLVTTA